MLRRQVGVLEIFFDLVELGLEFGFLLLEFLLALLQLLLHVLPIASGHLAEFPHRFGIHLDAVLLHLGFLEFFKCRLCLGEAILGHLRPLFRQLLGLLGEFVSLLERLFLVDPGLL